MAYGASQREREEQRQKWMARLLEEFTKLEPCIPKGFVPEDEECPEWVRRIELEIAAVIMPRVRVKQEARLTPQWVGALIGHQCAIVVWMLEWMVMRAAVEQQLTPKRLTQEAKDKAKATASLITEKWYPGMRRLAKIALCSSVDQSYEDMTDFLSEFSKAFAGKPKTLVVGNIGNPTFEIYLFMVMYWRLVGGLKSVSELHSVLVRVFGAHRVGELKRIEKVCQRIGLHYRKPGRPKGTGVIQTP